MEDHTVSQRILDLAASFNDSPQDLTPAMEVIRNHLANHLQIPAKDIKRAHVLQYVASVSDQRLFRLRSLGRLKIKELRQAVGGDA